MSWREDDADMTKVTAITDAGGSGGDEVDGVYEPFAGSSTSLIAIVNAG
jgi:hypothetical protein